MSPHKLVFGKVCNLPVKLEHRAFWALRQLNLDIEAAGTSRVTKLHELDELCYHAFESTRLYRERMKIIHDKHIQERIFKPGDVVLLYNSRLKLFPVKLKSRWSGPFRVVEVLSCGVAKIESDDGTNRFKVNGQRLKHYPGIEDENVVSVIHLKEPQILSEP
ncbi:uncharacterized protein [Nicotiana tomentosiformis]|uniref:uncharacterized protein n=1 Tax=Nicotiana tomentosiformis TaxID=4098 RepID=UPI00388C3C45